MEFGNALDLLKSIYFQSLNEKDSIIENLQLELADHDSKCQRRVSELEAVLQNVQQESALLKSQLQQLSSFKFAILEALQGTAAPVEHLGYRLHKPAFVTETRPSVSYSSAYSTSPLKSSFNYGSYPLQNFRSSSTTEASRASPKKANGLDVNNQKLHQIGRIVNQFFPTGGANSHSGYSYNIRHFDSTISKNSIAGSLSESYDNSQSFDNNRFLYDQELDLPAPPHPHMLKPKPNCSKTIDEPVPSSPSRVSAALLEPILGPAVQAVPSTINTSKHTSYQQFKNSVKPAAPPLRNSAVSEEQAEPARILSTVQNLTKKASPESPKSPFATRKLSPAPPAPPRRQQQPTPYPFPQTEQVSVPDPEATISVEHSKSSKQSSPRPKVKTSPGAKKADTIDGRNFFKKARNQLTYDEFTALLYNVKAYNVREQTKTSTLTNLEEILLPNHLELFKEFSEMISI